MRSPSPSPALLAAWEATRVEIRWLHGLEVVPSIAEARVLPRGQGLTGPCGHVITAWNPVARPLFPHENAARHAALCAVVAAAGLPGVPATGRAVDGSWHEDGIFVPARGALTDARETALTLGRAFGQVGIYEIEGGRLRALACADGAVVAPLAAGAGASGAG